jgi:hypothetical protein
MSEIVNKLIDTSTALIQQLAVAVGTTAAHIYQVLVTQQVIEGVLGVASVLSLIFGAIGIATLADKSVKKAFPENYTPQDKILTVTMGLFAGLYILSLALPPLTVAINKAINPEYFAILRILSEVK